MPMKSTTRNAVRVAIFVLFVAVILVATLVFHIQDHVGDMLDWIEKHRVAGSLTFVALYAFCTGEPSWPDAVMRRPGGRVDDVNRIATVQCCRCRHQS